MNTLLSKTGVKSFKSFLGLSLIISLLTLSGFSNAAVEVYKFDTKGKHAFIQFKIPHLGYSMLLGQFVDFDGGFVYNTESPEKSTVQTEIKMKSVDTHHGERDKHLRGKDFFNVDKHPTATFKSTQVEMQGDESAKVTGDFTLNGVTKPIVLEMSHIGNGDDPWGGYRRGFEGTAKFKLKDFNINYDLGKAAEKVEIYLSIEGVRQ